MKLNRLFILLLFCQICRGNLLLAQADKVVEITEGTSVYNLGESIYLLEDKSQTATFDQAKLKQAGFILSKEPTPNLGFTKSDWWFKVHLKNNSGKDANFILNIPYPFFNQLDLYVSDTAGSFAKETVGDHFNFSERKINHKYFLFPIKFKAGEQKTIYGKLFCDGEATSLPMQLLTEQALNEHDNNEQILLGLYYGILIFALVLSIFLGLTLRERENIYYVIYVIGAILFQGSLDGLTFQFIWPNLPWLANHIIPLSAGISLFALIKFSQIILNIKEWFSGFNKVLSALLVLIGLTAIASVLPNPFYGLSIPIISVFALLSDVLLFASALLSFRKGNKTARYFLVSFSILLAAIIIAQLKNFGILPRVFVTEYGMQIGSAIELILLSFALAERVKTLREEKEVAQARLLKELAERAKMQEEENIRLEQKVNERTAEVVKQKEIIEEKQKEILDSINYAKRIQYALLASDELLQKNLKEHFIFFKPKDVVSGDFYWAYELSNDYFAMINADSTGHGVPGAIMSILNISSLNEAVKENDLTQPAEILNATRKKIITHLSNDGSADGGKDGMDCSLVCFDLKNNKLSYAAANNPVWVVRGTELIALPADRMPVGKHERDKVEFAQSNFDLQRGDVVYTLTDGFPDQFGGPEGKKFKYKPLQQLLISISHLPMAEQQTILNQTFTDWIGHHEQIDDVCVIGVRV